MAQTMEPIKTVLKQPQRVLPPTRRSPLSDDVQYPPWFQNSPAARLPAESRIRCPRCFGRRSGAGRVLERVTDREGVIRDPGCVACWGGYAEGPCPAHTCYTCAGSGYVCPQCRGDRFISMDYHVGHPDFGKAERCPVCTEGNNISPPKEAAAIQRYLARHPL